MPLEEFMVLDMSFVFADFNNRKLTRRWTGTFLSMVVREAPSTGPFYFQGTAVDACEPEEAADDK